jgi:membrane protease YdiL (CAAX protease family)
VIAITAFEVLHRISGMKRSDWSAAMPAMTTDHFLVRFISNLATPRIRPTGAPLGFWETVGWFALANVACWAALFMLMQLGISFSLAEIICAGGMVSLLVSVVHRAGWSARRYLGLSWAPGYFKLGMCLLACEALLHMFLAYAFPSPEEAVSPFIREYRALAADPVALVLLWLVTGLIAPVTEEIVYRGFLLPGLMASRLGVAGSIVLTATIFAAAHFPGNPVYAFGLFTGGLILGLVRWLSGSTLLPMVMHAIWNVGILTVLTVNALPATLLAI